MLTQCPKCSHTFDAKRSGHGAAIARAWTQLPRWHLKFLRKWYDDPIVRAMWLDKAAMRGYYKYVGVNALNARISELLALDLVATDGKGRYRLTEKVELVLSQSGMLMKEIMEK